MNSFPLQEFHQIRALPTRNQDCRLNTLVQQLESLCVHACGRVCAYVCAWVLVYYIVVKLILLPPGFFLQVAKVEDAPTPSAIPVMELELTEEKLPMSLSRQEVSHEP